MTGKCKHAECNDRIKTCVHEFCKECLVDWQKSYRQGYHLSCPLCRNLKGCCVFQDSYNLHELIDRNLDSDWRIETFDIVIAQFFVLVIAIILCLFQYPLSIFHIHS